MSGIPLSVKYPSRSVQRFSWSPCCGRWSRRANFRRRTRRRSTAHDGTKRARCALHEIATSIARCPDDATARRGAGLHWIGLFCMWLFFVPATAVTCSEPPIHSQISSTRRASSGRLCPLLLHHVLRRRAGAHQNCARRAARRFTTRVALRRGSGLVRVSIHERYLLILSMIGVGIAGHRSVDAHAILSTALPPTRMGVYMGCSTSHRHPRDHRRVRFRPNSSSSVWRRQSQCATVRRAAWGVSSSRQYTASRS